MRFDAFTQINKTNNMSLKSTHIKINAENERLWHFSPVVNRSIKTVKRFSLHLKVFWRFFVSRNSSSMVFPYLSVISGSGSSTATRHGHSLYYHGVIILSVYANILPFKHGEEAVDRLTQILLSVLAL